MTRTDERPVVVTGELLKITPRGAYLVQVGESQFFLPIASIAVEPAGPAVGDVVSLTVPAGLAREKGLKRQEDDGQGSLL